MSCIYLNAGEDDYGLPAVELERVFKADFVFDKAYPKKTFVTSVPEYVFSNAVNGGGGYDYEFDPVMWYCSQMNDSYTDIKWWDTPNGNNCDAWNFEELEKELFPYNTPIKCEEQIVGLGKSKKRTFWLKKVVVQSKSAEGYTKFTSCMAEGKKKYGIYKIKIVDYWKEEPIGWEFDMSGDGKFADFAKKQGIDMSKIVKNVYSEIQPDGKIR